MARSTPTPPKIERIKFVYNAQFPAETAIVLDYLLNNPHFTSRQGRQKGMDAIAAFYRPMAEESRGELPEEQTQEVARNCIEVLSKQIDDLRTRYKLDEIAPPDDSLNRSGKFEEILVSKLDAIADAIRAQSSGMQSRGAIANISTISPELTLTHSIHDFEQGIHMEQDELGNLEVTLDDIRSEYIS
jgi:hypothetical protein